MEKKTLFEIPIYSMSKKEFNRRWDKQKQKLHDTYVSHGHSEEDTQYYVSRFSFPRSLWEYNQIIGYIKISVSRHDVWFDIYCSLDKFIMLAASRSILYRTFKQTEHIFILLSLITK